MVASAARREPGKGRGLLVRAFSMARPDTQHVRYPVVEAFGARENDPGTTREGAAPCASDAPTSRVAHVRHP